jgi:hypothetical protein
MWQGDVSAERPIWKKDARQISFRAEAYNVMNTPQFADPVRYASNPMFGQSQSALNLMLGGEQPHQHETRHSGGDQCKGADCGIFCLPISG